MNKTPTVHIYSNVGNTVPSRFNEREPLGPLALQAYLNKAHPDVPVEVYDAAILGMETGGISQMIIKERPGIIGFSCFPGGLSEVSLLLERLEQERPREYKPVRLLGGYVSNLDIPSAGNMLGNIDAIIRGEGEVPLSTIISQAKKGSVDFSNVPNAIYRKEGTWARNQMVITPSEHVLQIRRDYLNVVRENSEENGKYGIASISTSRGCAGFCSFCTIHAFRLGKKFSETASSIGKTAKEALWVGRRVESVLEEIRKIAGMGVTGIDIVDDDFISTDPGRAKGILRGIMRMVSAGEMPPIGFWISTRVDRIARTEGNGISVDWELLSLLKHAGCRCVFLGLESGSESQLRNLSKNSSTAQNEVALLSVTKAGIRPAGGMIMFNPLSEMREVFENMEFIERTGAWEYISRLTNSLIVFNGSRMKGILEREGLLGEPNEEGTIYSYRFRDEKVRELAACIYEWNNDAGTDAFRKISLAKDFVSDFRFFGRSGDTRAFNEYLALKKIEWGFMKESINECGDSFWSSAGKRQRVLKEVRERHSRAFGRAFDSMCRNNPKMREVYGKGGTNQKQLARFS